MEPLADAAGSIHDRRRVNTAILTGPTTHGSPVANWPVS